MRKKNVTRVHHGTRSSSLPGPQEINLRCSNGHKEKQIILTADSPQLNEWGFGLWLAAAFKQGDEESRSSARIPIRSSPFSNYQVVLHLHYCSMRAPRVPRSVARPTHIILIVQWFNLDFFARLDNRSCVQRTDSYRLTLCEIGRLR